MPAKRVDFAALARTLLDAADRLVPLWLEGGRRAGHEWQCGNLAGEPGKSCSVNLTTGQWADFATGERGGDLISLYAAIHGLQPGEAAKRLRAELRIGGSGEASTRPPETKLTERETKRASWAPIVPVPETAALPPIAHPVRGRSEHIWCYRDRDGRILGYVHRFRTSDGGKEILPVVWARNARGREDWRWMQWAMPRPLYGLDRLRDGKRVLITEGEKCADVAHEHLSDIVDCLSWPGGGNAVLKVEWATLAGREILLWPDCDAKTPRNSDELLPEAKQPGVRAMETIAEQLLALGCNVRIVRIPAPGVKADGWDIADAVAEGATHEDLVAMLEDLRPCAAALKINAPAPQASAATSAGAGEPEDPGGEWRHRLLVRKHELVPCLANVVQIFTRDPKWAGVLAYDEFAQRVVKRKPLPSCGVLGTVESPEGDWTDLDTSLATVWLTNAYSITPATAIVNEAVELAAAINRFHPVRAYLGGLQWDGTERLEDWLADYFGVARSEYSTRVARWYLTGMVARVMRPGVKFDYCLVLEGEQGRNKSSALKILAGEWFSEAELDITSKDALSAIRGKWLHEFPEMGAIVRVESLRQKSFLSRTVDEFRPVYGHREIKCPRQIVFGGSTNEWQWNKDPTGGRRFWPVDVPAEVDLEGLANARDQLFAEALVRYRRGERFWPTGDEQRKIFDPVQLAREAEDAFMDPIHDWIERRALPEFTLHDVLVDALKLDAGRMTRDVMTRVGMQLKRMGAQRVERRNGTTRFVYRLPTWAPYWGRMQQAAPAAGGEGRDGPMPF